MSLGYVEVAVPPPVARELTYRLPADSADPVQVGALVLVPVSGRRLTGIVTRTEVALPAGVTSRQIRPIESVIDPQALSAELIELCAWLTRYYFASLGSALMAALPPGLQLASNRLVQLRDTGVDGSGLNGVELRELDTRVVEKLRSAGPQRVTGLRRHFDRKELESSLRRLRTAGLIEITPVLPASRARSRTAQHVRVPDPEAAAAAAAECETRAPRQAACLRYLLEAREPRTRTHLVDAGFAQGVLGALAAQGLIERYQAEIIRDPLAHLELAEAPLLHPTAAQQSVLQELSRILEQRRFHSALLHGVTGSGKTLVYMELVAATLDQGRGTIILVPEIALAWQMVRRFRARFGDQVAVLHSQLSNGERYDTWRRLRRGDQRLVIGARSAVLAPLPDLGLIVVDEEHDASYKQEDLDSAQPLVYNARDLALVRGRQAEALVVLGSATPSLESHLNAQSGKYQLYQLPRRIGDRPLPKVQVVDMRQEPYQGRQRPVFSRALRQKIRERLERHEQIVLLQNRRGFSPFIVCGSCGETVECETCRISLTYHRQGSPAEMRCHYCDFRAAPPQVCSSCGAAELRFQGVGTQKVEEALTAQFRGVRVIRMDVDTTGWKGAHDQLVEHFRNGEADVLLGTQMVAKGLDFPEVTLVGVISADTGMHLPDFRAAERSFQLLTQVAGRSGRGERPGEVVVQTLLPDDAVLRTAAAQDFAAFACSELSERQAAGFPPYGRLVLLRWRGQDEGTVETTAQRGTQAFAPDEAGDLMILGPAPAPLARLRGSFRYQTLLRCGSAQQLHHTVARHLRQLRETCPSSVELTVNVDPMTIM
jgi:primosomal protein N' (replication factor Y) (superfamily II helicase)